MQKKKNVLRAKFLPPDLRKALEPKIPSRSGKAGRMPGVHQKTILEMGLRPGDIPPHFYKYKLSTFKEKVKELMPEVRRKEALWEELKNQPKRKRKRKKR